jgi:H/ACA ribonucleoprotein complex non-core subunit NAF1
MDLPHDEAADFELPPAKRQCTQSPRLSPITGQSNSPAINAASKPVFEETAASANMTDMTSSTTATVSIPGLGALEEKEVEAQKTEEPETTGILDMLMQYVEAASNPTPSHESAEAASEKHRPGAVGASDPETELSDVTAIHETHRPQEDNGHKVDAIEDVHSGIVAPMEPELEIANQDITMSNQSADMISGIEENGTSAQTIPANAQEAEPEAAEWEADSSPLESSSDSNTSDLSSSDEDSDEEMDGEYAMLGLEEQARILMQGDGGSDDEGGESKVGDKADRVQLRSANEKPEEVVPKPNITLTDEKIEELGVVEGIVESTVLIKAKVSGEYQVLEAGSLLCLKDRAVVGVVTELFGRVEQPMYTIRFTNDAAIQEAGLSVPGTPVYYVEPPHSTFVFTQPLKSIKGSDASNFHDEEVGDDEMEFSDDEAEAEHKRRLKLKRQGRKDDRSGRNAYQSDSRRSSVSHAHDGSANGSAYGSGAIQMNYDDVDEGYTPLARPSNLHMMAQGQAPLEGRQHQPTTTGRSNDRGRGRGHGRGRGFDRGRGRGSRPSGQNKAQWNEKRAPEPAFSPRYPSAPPAFALPPTSPYQHQQNFQQPLQQPSGPPQMPAYPPFSPSPISPLPGTHFNFNAQQPQQWQQQQQQQQYGAQNMPNYQYGGPQHAQSQMPMPPPGSHINPAFLEALRQHQQQGHHR